MTIFSSVPVHLRRMYRGCINTLQYVVVHTLLYLLASLGWPCSLLPRNVCSLFRHSSTPSHLLIARVLEPAHISLPSQIFSFFISRLACILPFAVLASCPGRCESYEIADCLISCRFCFIGLLVFSFLIFLACLCPTRFPSPLYTARPS